MRIFFSITLILVTQVLFAQKQTTMTLHFDTDKYNIRPKEAALLDSLASTIRTGIRIEISGHCDVRGSDEYNNALSVQRAKSVEIYLLAKGVDASMITKQEGYGETMPLVDARIIAMHSINRRVEIIITTPEEKIVEVPVEKPIEKPVEKTLTRTIEDTATKKGTTIVLKNLNFVGGNHILLPESIPIIEELLAVMKNNPQLVISIQGHVCCENGNVDGVDFATGDRNLSVARAAAVHNYLEKNGIAANRISYQGFGHRFPIYPYPEKSDEERVTNRRVEIVIISK